MRKTKAASALSDKALEKVMWNVLSGMEDFSLNSTYKRCDFGLEILAIEPQRTASAAGANVIFPPQFQR